MNEQDLLINENPQPLSLEEISTLVLSFQDQLAGLDYRVTNKNFGSKIYQTKEQIASKGRFIAGAKEDVVIMDGQNPTWRLWAGASDPASAPFRVDKDGNVTASSITLTGYIPAGGAAADVNANSTTVSGGKIAANSITASKMSVSTLSSITADIGTITAGSITGVTITGGTIRTASSGTRVELDGANNEINIYSGSTRRARGNGTGWDWYTSGGTQIGSIFANSQTFVDESGGTSSLNALSLLAVNTSTASVYLGAGSSGAIGLNIGTTGSTQRLLIQDSIMVLGDTDDLNFVNYSMGKLKLLNGLYMDMAGSVISGSLTGGTKPLAYWSLTHSSTGIYSISHNLGTANFTVIVTLRNSTATLLHTVSVHSSSTITIRIGTTAGTLTDADFDFAVFLWF